MTDALAKSMTLVQTPGLPIRNRHRIEALTACTLAAPGFFLLLVLFVLPAAGVFVIAATDWQFGARTLNYVGLANFRALIEDAQFRASFANTLTYVAVVVPATVVLGLFLALMIESGRGFRAFYRAVHFIPVMATLAATAIAWEALLHPTIGLINHILHELGGPRPNWLGDPDLALGTLMAIGVWQQTGFAMVLFLAGLRAIPQDLYDAAAVDGADGPLSRLFTVTLPMLGPVMMFVLIVIALRAFEAFDTVQILTQGGPGHASEMLLYTLYIESFEYFRVGYGAAVTIVFLFIVIALTLLQARVLDRRVHYG